MLNTQRLSDEANVLAAIPPHLHYEEKKNLCTLFGLGLASVAHVAVREDARLLGRRDQMFRKLIGKIVALELDVDEVHGQRELVGVQHPVFVDVRQFPDFAEDVVGQLRLDHLLLGG